LRAVARVDERGADRRIEGGAALDGGVLRSAVCKLLESFRDVRRRGAEQYRAVSEPLPAVDGLIGDVVQRALRMTADEIGKIASGQLERRGIARGDHDGKGVRLGQSPH